MFRLVPILILLLVGPGPGPHKAPVDRSPAPDANTIRPDELQRIRLLVQDLGNPDWPVRDRSTRALSALGPEIFPLLASSFANTSDYHVRLAIRSVVYKIFTRARLGQQGAFLGVSQRFVLNPKLIEGRAGILVVQVLPGTAAADAGLLDGDIILAIDGRPVNLHDQTARFAQRIRLHPPGTQVILEVFRHQETIQVPVRLGSRPLRFADRDLRHRLQFAFSQMWHELFVSQAEDGSDDLPLPR